MDENSIRKYANLMRELGLTGLEIDKNGDVIRLEMSPAVSVAPAAAIPAPAVSTQQENADDGSIKICSPMVGVFYAAPAEDAEPFVHVGDSVRKGDVLCIIEAMKLMNEIVAEQDGVISEICVSNNQVVDYGRVLFKLRKEIV